MDVANIQIVTFVVVFLVLYPKIQSMPYSAPPFASSPLCLTQFALVNHACALVPFTPGPPPSPPENDDGGGDNYNDDDNGNGYGDDGGDDDDDGDNDRDHGHGHGHGHVNGRGHRHRHRHGHRATPSEYDCCRWMREVDTECVCKLLVHLPSFLVKLAHNYTVMVNDECNVTFECGRLFRI